MVSMLFVANRGEIARRVFRTCREMGIAAAAGYVEPELHCDEADVAVRVSSFLDAEGLVRAAVESGADAVHPGYGFLSENAAFARLVIEAGLTWIGPPPDAIEAMGSKIGAKKLMADAGVPVLSGTDRFPVLVKASAGGGGRGMRIVRTEAELEAALESARSEAESAFGDPTVFTEPYIEASRHIEVQVLADAHGRVWTLGERECSVQRRHQKVVEEAPSPLSTLDRAALFAAAAKAAEAIGYVGAGTVEFLVDGHGSFYFLEMNTRLQVEHPVTELVYGVDLVRLQIEVARGLALDQAPPVPQGHAIEVRLYAEDPAAGWLPQSGRLHRFEIPAGVRVDSGVESGSFVGVAYDPMLAKVIAHAPTRSEAAARLARALSRSRIHGLRTNRDLLVRVLRDPVFLAGEATTAFLENRSLLEAQAAPEVVELSAVAAARAIASGVRDSGWRNVRSQPRRRAFEECTVEFTPEPDDRPDRVTLQTGSLRRVFDVSVYDGGLVEVDSALGPVTLHRKPRFTAPSEAVSAGSLLAPMPGTVVRLGVAVGDTVEKGQTVLWLEAMKMEHRVVAPSDGVVTSLNVEAGQQVQVGARLAVVEGR